MKCTIRKSSGFTLIELLLYVSISSIILLTTSVFLSALLESRIKNQTIAEVEQQGSFVLQSITQALRNSESINAPLAGSSSGTLSLNVLIPLNDPTIFDVSSGIVQMKEGGGAYVPLTTSRVSISNLVFTNLSRVGTPGTVRIEFIVSYVNSEGRYEYEFSKRFIGSATLRQP